MNQSYGSDVQICNIHKFAYMVYMYYLIIYFIMSHRIQVFLPTFTIEKDHPNVGKPWQFLPWDPMVDFSDKSWGLCTGAKLRVTAGKPSKNACAIHSGLKMMIIHLGFAIYVPFLWHFMLCFCYLHRAERIDFAHFATPKFGFAMCFRGVVINQD